MSCGGDKNDTYSLTENDSPVYYGNINNRPEGGWQLQTKLFQQCSWRWVIRDKDLVFSIWITECHTSKWTLAKSNECGLFINPRFPFSFLLKSIFFISLFCGLFLGLISTWWKLRLGKEDITDALNSILDGYFLLCQFM